MISPEDALKIAAASKTEITKLLDAAMHSFALTKDEKYEGVAPLLLIGYQDVLPVLKELRVFLHNLTVLEAQVMNYMETMGASIDNAVSTLQNPIVLSPLFPGGL
jgi:hypothetical protein